MARRKTERLSATVPAEVIRDMEKMAAEKGLSLSAYTSMLLTKVVRREKTEMAERLQR